MTGAREGRLLDLRRLRARVAYVGTTFGMQLFCFACLLGCETQRLVAAPDASSHDSGVDGGAAPSVDAQLADGCPVDPLRARCSSDSDCASTQFCAVRVGACIARCNADGEQFCGPPLAENPLSLAAQRDRVFWLSATGELWRWSLGAAPQRLFSVPNVLGGGDLLADDDLLYLQIMVRTNSNGAEFRAYRASATESATPQDLGVTISGFWTTATRVMWTRPGDAGQSELWAVGRATGSAPALVGTRRTGTWVTSTDEYAVLFAPATAETAAALVVYDLPALDLVRRVELAMPTIAAPAAVMAGKFLYYADFNGIDVVPVDVQASPTVLWQMVMPGSQSDMEVSGDWLFWSAYGRSNQVLRTHLRAAVPSAVFALDPRINRAAVDIAHNRLLMWDPDSLRLVSRTMERIPCGADFACPSEMTCAADRFCQSPADPVADSCAIARSSQVTACAGSAPSPTQCTSPP